MQVKDIDEALKYVDGATAVEKLIAAARPAQATGALPPIVSASQLVRENLKLPERLIRGLLHRGSTMILGGGPKTNKTFCLCDMAISVAAGVEWWNMETKKGKVLYLDFECQKPFFAKRLDGIVEAKNLSLEVLDNIDVWNLRGHAADLSKQVDEILETIKAKEYALIIIDPIYKAMGNRDENKAGDINSLLNEIDKIAVNTGAAVVIGHHFSKGNQAGKESLDRISGSGVFGRSPDAILVLTKHEEQDVYVVESTLRNFKRIEPFCVIWEYPLMGRADNFDPKKLKRPGAAQAKYTTAQLLEVLGAKKLATNKWRDATCEKTGMSQRTFAVKKKELEDEGKIKEVDGLWEFDVDAVAGNKKEKEEVQSANGATAASAPAI